MIFKRVIVVCLSILYLGIFLFPSDTVKMKENFKQGISAYEGENYQQALEFFLNARKIGNHQKLLYNIGNTYYKLKDYLNAKIYYLMALKLDPANRLIRTNIDIVNKKFKDQIEKEEIDFLKNILIKFESFFSPALMSIIILIMVFFLNGMLFFLLRRGKKKLLIYTISFSLIFLVIIFGYFLVRVNKINNHNKGVVLLKEAILRSGPGENNTVLYKIHSGLEVKIINKSQGWVYVSAGSKINGWIKKDSIIEI